MSRYQSSRRSFILGAAAAISGGLAGCAAVEPPGGEPERRPARVETRDATDDRFVSLYEAVNHAVVEIRVQIPEGPFDEGGGSGFFIDNDIIVTNSHVVLEQDRIEIRYANDSWDDGTVLGRDPHSDLAVIKADNGWDESEILGIVEDFPRVGEEVMAIGSPLGFSASASTGIVSGIDRSLPAPHGFSIPAAIQTDAAVNPGNSGGPLVNLDGVVLGVVFAGAGGSMGFAISGALANRVLPVLRTGETFEHSYLGVRLADVTPRVATANELPEVSGVYIHQVLTGGPADDILHGTTDEQFIDGQVAPVGGDVIRRMNETEIPHLDALSTFLALETDPGDVIDIDLYRDGEPTTVSLELGTRPETADQA